MKHTQPQTSLANILKRLAVAVAFVVCTACAGGSSGTGGRTYDGTVTSSSTGRTLSGVTVMIEGTGDTAVTDAGGHYTIESDSEEETVVFEFNGPSIEASYTLPNVSSNAEVVTADFEIEEDTDEVVLDRLQVQEHEEHQEGQNVQQSEEDEQHEEQHVQHQEQSQDQNQEQTQQQEERSEEQIQQEEQSQEQEHQEQNRQH
jgi:flagellar biosynthesis GTPase FlhF